MSKTAILRFLNGNLQSGYPVVELRIIDQQTGRDSSFLARLPSSPELYELLRQFSEAQRNWGRSNHLWRNRPTGYPRGLELPDDPLTNKSLEIVEQIQQALDNWLDEKSFAPIKNEFLGDAREIKRLLIETSDLSLQKIPWKRWQIIERFCPNTEIAFFYNETYLSHERLRNPVRILAILGRDTNIDLEVDRGFLEKMPAAVTTIIPNNPDQELTLDEFYQTLSNETYDILFFAGHSLTDTEGTDTRLWINSQDSVTIDNLSGCLRDAVDRGLKIAIFNSCSGLGIPRKLSAFKISIPYLIVMIEPIHDKLAQKFLEIFLINHFVTGKSLQKSFQTALSNLRVWQHQSPNADFLPVLFHNPKNPSIFYPKLNFLDHIKLLTKAKDKKEQFSHIFKKLSWWKSILISIATFLMLMLIYYFIIKPDPQLMSSFCPNNSDYITCGDKNLINYSVNPEARKFISDGQNDFYDTDYSEAFSSLEKAFQKEKDPATLIAKNNVEVFKALKWGKIKQENIYTIAVVIPFDIESKVIGKNMLANVAKKQSEFNTSNSSPGRLIVLMANDSNQRGEKDKKGKGETIASELGKNHNVIAVVGPYSSLVAASVIDDYEKNKLIFIAPSVTTSLPYLKEKCEANTDKQDLKDKCKVASFFFRTASTTEFAAKDIIKYLKSHGYEKIILYYYDTELFGLSFYRDFLKGLKSEPTITKAKEYYLGLPPENMAYDIDSLKKNYEKDKTAIVLLADAFTNENAQKNKRAIIEKNNGHFLIMGSNPVQDPEILKLTPKALEKVIITVPDFPTQEQKDAFLNVFGSKDGSQSVFKQNEGLTWHGLNTYRAADIITKTISAIKQSGQTPSKESIQSFLSEEKVQDVKFNKDTRKLTLEGSDRQEQSTVLIQPDCSSNSCQGWKEVLK